MGGINDDDVVGKIRFLIENREKGNKLKCEWKRKKEGRVCGWKFYYRDSEGRVVECG